MNKTAVIVAGGSGLRMGSEIPKQFLPLKGKPLLWHTINTFLSAYEDLNIVLVLPEAHLQYGQQLAAAFPGHRIQITTGGTTRFHSVKNGLAKVQHPAIVFVHDGVRCLLTTTLIQRCFEQAVEKGSAIPVVTATDSIRLDDGHSHHAINRQQIKIVQTPQTFQSEMLLKVFDQPYNEAFTDEATVVESAGIKVHLIEGEYNNIKVTRPIDLLIAENILDSRL
jgi:2-C-methyl-D-erythritol 4-phosphate cytidylyltransferase